MIGHTRAEANVFFWRMLNGPEAVPPKPTVQIYNEVPPLNFQGNPLWYYKWVGASDEAGIIQNCVTYLVSMLFRPEEEITRAEAACMMYYAITTPPPES